MPGWRQCQFYDLFLVLIMCVYVCLCMGLYTCECRYLWVGEEVLRILQLELQVIVSCQHVGVDSLTWALGKRSVHSDCWAISAVLWRHYHFVQTIRPWFVVKSFTNSLQLFENSGNSISCCSSGILFQPQVAASQYIK